MRKLIVLAVWLFGGVQVASAAGNIYVQASAFEYRTPNSCVAAARVGTDQPYVVASCAAGQSFFFHVTLPNDAGPGGPGTPNTPGLGQPKYQPVIHWSAQSTQSGTVCWNTTAMVIHSYAGFGGAAVLSAFDDMFFRGPVSAPSQGMLNSSKQNVTGTSTTFSLAEVAIGDSSPNGDGGAATVDCNGFDTPLCQNNPMVVKVTRNVTCNGTVLTGNADVHTVRLKYN